MSVLTIRTYPDSVLRKKSDSVDRISPRIEKLADEMIQTLRWANGVGLAAPQVGELVRVAVIDPGGEDASKGPLCLVNPEIVETRGTQTAEEGCLSIPGIYETLERPAFVLVRGLDICGNPVELECRDILARAISHEIDHLDGILFIDRLTSIRRSLLKGKLKNLSKNSDLQDSQSPQ
jgi:peptide deformylase